MKKGQRQCLTSPDRQLQKHEKTMQKPCSGWSCNGSFGGSSGLRPARSRNSQTPAGFKPNLSKNQPPKNCLTSPSDAHKKDVKKGQRQCLTSPDRQLRKREKTVQKPCSGWSCGWSCNGSFGGSSGLRSARSRNSQTPAGFKPNLSKNQPPKNCLTSPSDAHKKDEEGQRQCLTSPDRQLRKHEKTMQKPCIVDGAVDGAAMAPSVAAPASVRHGAETAKPQQDSSPTCPKTSPRKTA